MKPVLRFASAAIALLLLVVAPPRARGAFILTLTQSGGNVVVAGNGTINTTALSIGLTANGSGGGGGIEADDAQLYGGPAGPTSFNGYVGGGLTGPASLGTGGHVIPSSGTGPVAGIGGFTPFILLPLGYVSGTPLSNSSTYTGQTFATLGFTPGTYVYTWGTGVTADSLTVTSIVPEPSTWVLLGTGAVGVGMTALRRRRGCHRR